MSPPAASVIRLRAVPSPPAPRMSADAPSSDVSPRASVPTFGPQLSSVRESTRSEPPARSSPRTERAAGGSLTMS